MPLRAKYIALAAPAWPPNPKRMNVIYATIARAIRRPNQQLKGNLLAAVEAELVAFNQHYAAHLATQAAFDAWFSSAAGRIMALPFPWTDALGVAHAALSFGATQKFLNLGLKDWWALSANGTNLATPVGRLHGPLDQIVYACSSRFAAPLPSLVGPSGTVRSYVSHLAMADYLTYQAQLDVLANRFAASFNLGRVPARIEIEQLLWGWV